ncbi:MAG: branched-chain amino acid ABC transporter permease [Limnochordia bacterium]|jgi:branched-chain amino acid transport system permease protein
MLLLQQQIYNGLAIGMVYALIAVGYSLIFGVLRLVNFSHGSVYAFSAHMAMFFVGMKFGIGPAILLSVLCTGLLYVVINKTALEPLRQKKGVRVASLITTIGVANVIQNLLMIIFNPQKKPFPAFYNFGVLRSGSILIQSTQIVMFVVSLILLVILSLVVNRTKIGLAMRATEQNYKAANLMGIDVNSTITFTFFLCGASAAIAGVLVSGYYQMVYPTMGVLVGLKAFAAAVFGGIGVLHGSIVGGLIIGLAESFAATTLGPSYRDAVAFVLLILVLSIRPAGLFGKKNITKV